MTSPGFVRPLPLASVKTANCNRTGTRMSLSFSRALDSGIGSFISIRGSLSCKYPSTG